MKKPTLYPFYCHTELGRPTAEPVKSENFDQLPNCKIVNAPNKEIAEAAYKADLKNGTLKKGNYV